MRTKVERKWEGIQQQKKFKNKKNYFGIKNLNHGS